MGEPTVQERIDAIINALEFLDNRFNEMQANPFFNVFDPVALENHIDDLIEIHEALHAVRVIFMSLVADANN